MKTKIKLLLASSLFFTAVISEAQTWSHGSDAIQTGIPSGGLGGASATNGSLLFYNASNTNTLTINTGATSTTYSLTLPTAQGSAGTVLQNNGSGNLSWAAVSGLSDVYETSLSLTSAQILSLSPTSGIDIIVAPGAGKYIEVISASFIYTFVTTAYTTNTNLVLINNGAGNPQASCFGGITSTSNRIANFAPYEIGAFTTGTQITENTSLQISTLTGNPSAGDGTAKVKVLYRIVTI